MEDDAIRGKEFEVTGDEAGLGIAFAGDLALAVAGGGINAPGDFASGDIFVASDFGGDPLAVNHCDSDDFLEVAAVVADPFTGEGGGGGRRGNHGAVI